MNPYYPSSNIPTGCFLYLLSKWADKCPIGEIVKSTGFSDRTVKETIRRVRCRIAENGLRPNCMLEGVVQVDAWCLSSRKIGYQRKGVQYPSKRPLLMGFMNSEKQVFIIVIPDRKQLTLHSAIRRFVSRGSKIITSGWGAYRGIDKTGEYTHERVKVGRHPFLKHGNLGVCLGDFWSMLESMVSSRKGVPGSVYISTVKECEFVWNNRMYDKAKQFDLLLEIIYKNPLSNKVKSHEELLRILLHFGENDCS
jgi:hypothetical protein